MIIDLIHPEYSKFSDDWFKWRLAYEGGPDFVYHYLEKFSQKEDDTDFLIRKRISYCPRFAGTAIDEVKNSIYQRFVDITRVGGSKTYQDSINGLSFGVDLLGNTMSSFMGRIVLPELLVMKKVAIFVDMPNTQTKTKADLINSPIRPYLYIYNAEDIRSWCYDDNSNSNEFKSVLIREKQYQYDETFNLPTDTIDIFKHFFISKDGLVNVNYYDEDDQLINPVPIVLNINKIPVIILNLSHSLMKDIADYQIALLNLASSDLSYSLKSNFPFYIEQYDPRASSPYLKDSESKEIEVGAGSGRRYPIGMNAPTFINPSSEPLVASMQKQEQLKQEIRLLVNLSISSLKPTISSAESKGFDERSLESGLSYIGLELEQAERRIAQIWSDYENNNNVASIKYPEKYQIKSDEDRRKDSKQLSELLPIVPSKVYQKEVAKMIADSLLGNRISENKLREIEKEIETSSIINIDSKTINQDVEQGILSLETASKAKGYPKGEVEKAKNDHAERLARISLAQAQKTGINNPSNENPNNLNNNLNNPASRGIPDLSPTPNTDSSNEKKNSLDTTLDSKVTDKTRGEGK